MIYGKEGVFNAARLIDLLVRARLCWPQDAGTLTTCCRSTRPACS
jgi:hypothetical protein